MDKQRRNILKRQYKEEKIAKGIFSFCCKDSGQHWVDASSNLPAAKQRLEFSLQHGHHRNKNLQDCYNRCGSEAFEFTTLEDFESDLSAFSVRSLSKERREFWLQQLQGQRCN